MVLGDIHCVEFLFGISATRSRRERIILIIIIIVIRTKRRSIGFVRYWRYARLRGHSLESAVRRSAESTRLRKVIFVFALANFLQELATIRWKLRLRAVGFECSAVEKK